MQQPRAVTVRALIVPADLRRHVEVRELALTSAALSDVIGGGLLDDALHATYADCWYTVYLDEGRADLRLPANERAAVLSARLGTTDRHWLAGLRGDALFVGSDPHRNDEDLPRAILDAARTAGILPCHPPSSGRPTSSLPARHDTARTRGSRPA